VDSNGKKDWCSRCHGLVYESEMEYSRGTEYGLSRTDKEACSERFDQHKVEKLRITREQIQSDGVGPRSSYSL
jgi:hypothetical protein